MDHSGYVEEIHECVVCHGRFSDHELLMHHVCPAAQDGTIELSGNVTDAPEIEPDEFPAGTEVRKNKGYEYPGIVVSSFTTLAGKRRYVVECTVPQCAGMLHIYNGNQLERV